MLDIIIERLAAHGIRPYFQDSDVVIINADCREILPILEPGSIDLVLTDPPYGVRSDLSWDDLNDFEIASVTMGWLAAVRPLSDRLLSFFSGSRLRLLQSLCALLYPEQRLMFWHKPEGSQYAGSSHDSLWYSYEAILYCHQGRFATPKELTVANLLRAAREKTGISRGAVDMAIRGKRTGLCFRWEEAACLPTDEQAAALRSIIRLDDSFYTELANARRQIDIEKASGTDVFIERTVINPSHPTEKPLPLLRDLVNRLSIQGQTILDLFAGSGTTLRAAKDLGRKAIGIEISEKYCEIAARRMSQQAMRLQVSP